jgi:NDP-sugar pyrophosphorylase family protein
MPKVQLLIPMSGQGKRFQNAGYKEPKASIEVNGKAVISRLLDNFPESWPTTFVLAENHRNTKLPSLLQKKRPTSRQIFIPVHEKGPGHAILAALDQLEQNSPVFVSYCDYAMIWDPKKFESIINSNCDAAVIAYRGFHAHYLRSRLYAYMKVSGDRVTEIKEKAHFTDNNENEYASSGGYFFRSAKILREALEYQIEKEMTLQGELYTSLSIAALLKKNPNAEVKIFEIETFYQFGTPEDLEDCAYWENTFSALKKKASNEVEQILMPMAGLGSRFLNTTSIPKPLIPILDKPMYEAALSGLPKAKKKVLVTIDSIAEKIKTKHELIRLDKTPDGQALSTEAGLAKLDQNKEVIVSACDHRIVLSQEVWAAFRKENCDAAAFVIKGYPGVSRNPLSYSYILCVNTNSLFPEIKLVSLKKNISPLPQNDFLLVGSFWFKKTKFLSLGIEAIKMAGEKVNNELYLDGIFSHLKKMGLNCRVIPLEGFINWGDPDSLAEALYWQKHLGSRS